MGKTHKPARRRSRRGMLTFEWILLLTLLVIGIVGGLSAARNALLQELGDLSHGVEALNACPHSDEDPSGPADDESGPSHPHRPHGERPWWETTGD